MDFNPRAPCGARQPQQNEPRMSDLFQPTRPLRGATTVLFIIRKNIKISTHAPLAGRDQVEEAAQMARTNFNPRAPCGARPMLDGKRDGHLVFQPTRPLRGATAGAMWRRRRKEFQPTRPLRGATDDVEKQACLTRISTHAPLAGRDAAMTFSIALIGNFNPRAPCGARPVSG